MKATEIFELAERIAAMKTTKKEDKMRSRRPPRHLNKMSDASITALLQRKLEEAETLDKFLKDREKAHKKEEKKKEGLSVGELAMALMATYPIIGLILFMAMRH